MTPCDQVVATAEHDLNSIFQSHEALATVRTPISLRFTSNKMLPENTFRFFEALRGVICIKPAMDREEEGEEDHCNALI